MLTIPPNNPKIAQQNRLVLVAVTRCLLLLHLLNIPHGNINPSNGNTRNRLIQSSCLSQLMWDRHLTLFYAHWIEVSFISKSSKISPELRQRRSVLMWDCHHESMTLILNINPPAAYTCAYWLIASSNTPHCPYFNHWYVYNTADLPKTGLILNKSSLSMYLKAALFAECICFCWVKDLFLLRSSIWHSSAGYAGGRSSCCCLSLHVSVMFVRMENI